MVNNQEDRFPSRKNPRMSCYDYSQPGYYFVTVCTYGKKCIFGTTDRLNIWGNAVAQTIRDISAHISGVKVDKFVVMPNHIHMILILEEGGTTLSTVVGQMKSAATRQIRKLCPEAQVWQGSFHDHVIRGQADYEKIWDYIDTNPMRWEMDCFYEK